jgi:flagellar motor switch protein FliM
VVSIQPFRWKWLSRFSGDVARLINDLIRFLPLSTRTAALHQSLEDVVTQELGHPFSFQMRRMTVEETEGFVQQGLTKQGLFMVIGLTPYTEKAIIEVDLMLADAIIDRLLGGEGDISPGPRSLTEIEQGVFSYLLLKVLAHIYQKCGNSSRVHFRFEDFRFSNDDLVPILGKEPRLAVLTLEARIGSQSGFCRLIFPVGFVRHAFSKPISELADADQMEYSRRISQMGFVRTDLTAEVGRTVVREKELKGLKRGDVVLLDESRARWDGKSLSGTLSIRVGQKESAVLEGRIVPDDRRLKVSVEHISLTHPIGRL